MNARTLPAFSDVGLARAARAIQRAEDDIRAATAAITVPHTDSWERDRADYYHDAITGRDDDFAGWDDEANTQAILQIREAMIERMNPIAFAARVQNIVMGLMDHAATGHANACQRNASDSNRGTLG